MADVERFADQVAETVRELIERTLRPGTAGLGGEEHARKLRRDPKRVSGSTHFASMLAYGDFVLTEGPSIRCEAIPGLSGVATASEVQMTDEQRPQADLKRILTHFHFNEPPVAIEQHYGRESSGTLTGAGKGSLLPGRASFSQYLILTLGDRPLANPEPLVMTAERVEEWPPVGSTFVSERPTAFVDIEKLDDSDAKPVAHLIACNAVIVSDLRPVLPEDHQRSVLS
jgi:hypothetical protein